MLKTALGLGAIFLAFAVSLSASGMPQVTPAAAASITPDIIEGYLNPPPPGVGFLQPARVEFLPDGRKVRLLAPFAYGDLGRRTWVVPPGYITDGSSVPKVFWSFDMAPFAGKYRDASILHDYLCDLRATPTSEEAHLLFYEAMRTSGVERATAHLMWRMVSWFGPYWHPMHDKRYRPYAPDCVSKAEFPPEAEKLLKGVLSGTLTPDQASAELEKLKMRSPRRSACGLRY